MISIDQGTFWAEEGVLVLMDCLVQVHTSSGAQGILRLDLNGTLVKEAQCQRSPDGGEVVRVGERGPGEGGLHPSLQSILELGANLTGLLQRATGQEMIKAPLIHADFTPRLCHGKFMECIQVRKVVGQWVCELRSCQVRYCLMGVRAEEN